VSTGKDAFGRREKSEGERKGRRRRG